MHLTQQREHHIPNHYTGGQLYRRLLAVLLLTIELNAAITPMHGEALVPAFMLVAT